MQVNNIGLMPNMTSTNTSAVGSQFMTKEAQFKNELEEAQKRLEKAAKSGVMTEDQVTQRNRDIMAASIQMEAIFLKMLYNDMWKTVPKDELFGDDNAMDIYRDMYHEELTKQMALDGGIGLADFIYKQLTQNRG